MLRQSTYRHSRIVAGLLGLVLLTVVFVVATPRVSALSGSGPDDADLGAQPGDDYSYVVSSKGYAPLSIPTTTVLLYFTDNTSVKTVRIYDANLCTDPLNSAPAGGGNQRDRPATGTDNPPSGVDPIPPNGAHMTDYYVQSMDNLNISAVVSGVASDANNCYNAAPIVITIPNNTLRYEAGANRYRAQFVATIDGGYSGLQNRFTINVDSGGIVGYSAAGQPDPFGIARDYPYSGFRNYALPFAADCSVKGSAAATIQLYDLDNGDINVQAGKNMTTYLQEFNSGGVFLRNVPFTSITGTGSSYTTGANNVYTINSGSKQYVNLNFTAIAGNKYKLNMTDVYYVNVLQFRLPYDSIYYLTGCSPPTTASCGVAKTVPMYPEPGQPVQITATINYSGGPNPPNIAGSTMSVDPTPGAVVPVVTASGGMLQFVTTVTPATAQKYSIKWATNLNGTAISCGGTYGANDSFDVARKPYLSVTGGDIATGASISTPPIGAGASVPCGAAPPNGLAGIVSWNDDGVPGFGGAGGQYAAFAMNYIQDFVSGQPTASASQGTKLSFANVNYPIGASSSVDPATGFFGGMFASSPCIDIWNDHPATATAAPAGPVNGWNSGTYYVTGGGDLMTLSAAGAIPAGRQITVYVDGNVAIAGGGITYAATTYADRTQIPSFNLIVHGVIYIDKSVTQLDGFYAAVPDEGYATTAGNNAFGSPQAGTISTCSTGFASYNPTVPTDNISSNCNVQLTVNGAVAANQVWLLRTYGTLYGKTPAEVFNYTPEVWLAPSTRGRSVGSSQDYQSIVGLPPIL